MIFLVKGAGLQTYHICADSPSSCSRKKELFPTNPRGLELLPCKANLSLIPSVSPVFPYILISLLDLALQYIK